MGIVTIRNQDKGSSCRLDIHTALSGIQHTGQNYVGMSTYKDGRFYYKDSNGKVVELNPSDIADGYIGSGSVSHRNDKQPYVAHAPRHGHFSLAFDGFIGNSDELKDEIGGVFHTKYDAELASRIIFNGSNVVDGIAKLSEKIKGPYCLSLIMEDGSTYAARCPLGMRPFVTARGGGRMATATCSRGPEKIGLNIERDIAPGEILEMTDYDFMTLENLPPKEGGGRKLCSFLFGYWEYEDAFIDGIPVTIPKQRIGRWLAESDMKDGYTDKIDIVVPIPGSGIPYAEEYAAAIGKPLIFGLLKYPYAERSYPQETLEKRRNVARGKLSVIPSKVRGKRIALIDDSIRRGTQILEGPIKMLQEEGGSSDIHLRLGSPRNEKYCRADTPPGYSDSDLLANRYPEDGSMAKSLNIESVKFIPVDSFAKSITDGHDITMDELCLGCYTGGDFKFLDV